MKRSRPKSIYSFPKGLKNKGESRHLDPIVSHRVSYYNYTGRDICVGLRNGFKFPILSTTTLGRDDFTVRVEFTLRDQAKDTVANQILFSNEGSCDGLSELKITVKDNIDPLSRYHEVILEYSLTRDQLYSQTQGCYIEDLDILVGFTSDIGQIVHPFSREGRIIYNSFEERETSKTGFSLDYEFVNNHSHIDRLYVRMGTNVHALPGIKDAYREDGLYVRYGSHSSITHVTLDDDENLESYGVFKSYSDALDFNVEMMNNKRKIELARIEAELKEKVLEITRLKNEFEREKIELEAKYQQDLREAELEYKRKEYRMNEEKARMKDYYEERSYTRKDNSEWLKSIPAVLTAIAGILVAVGALKK